MPIQKEERKSYTQQYYAKNKVRLREYQREWRKNNPRKFRPEYAHEFNLRKFGLSVKDYASLLAKQNGVCAICQKPDKDNIRLAVDHCHATGRIRGLLCSNCNIALGNFYDNVDSLKAAISYLEASRENSGCV